ncbi:hypothetical protein HNR65_002169 [Desulfosalsimonas propionicica]|uniref:Uncharacterized protein n=1 Tax=Desulfosalsimonas propionicica TaxID=332175 RepID=A0A7W0HL34_9BACT|nr:hypothetical protein [Desulfosalsimonas propionicica]MBA2881838.1 hypothetical protein [Desulfosalsimonas propionicica]
MAYTTGSAADMDAVKTALVNACTANGWIEQTDGDGKTVLSNSGCYVRVASTTGDDGNAALELLGRTGLDTGDAPGVVSMRSIDQTAITFPVTYFAFVFAAEVFFVINYSDKYQWCAFGQSDQPGLPGTGNWVAASCGSADPYDISIRVNTGGDNSRTSAAIFWSTNSRLSHLNSWLHNDFETSYAWTLGNGSNAAAPVGIKYLTELVEAQPNQFSGEAVLLPIRAYKKRPENKVSQLLEVSYARHVRIDNYAPEQVVTLGTDEWMVFPFHKKNASQRNGGGGVNHTGTFGWAIKKA